MEVFTLDSILRREHVIDDYESCIWTDRFSAYGDFQLTIKTNSVTRSLFQTGTRLAIDKSMHVMTVDTIEGKTAEDGTELTEITGKSLEALLEDRAAVGSLIAGESKWTIPGKPGDIVRYMFYQICYHGLISSNDTIPFLQLEDYTDEFYPLEPDNVLEWIQTPDSLYNAIKKLCDVYDFGFRIVRPGEDSKLYFNVYPGLNRKTNQTFRPPVIFSSDLDTLLSTAELQSMAMFKNVAYVVSDKMNLIVYGPNVTAPPSGFDRRVLVVSMTDLEEAVPEDVPLIAEEREAYYADLNSRNLALMQQRGQEALAEHKRIHVVDGELNQRNNYVYGVDYFMGDLVEVQSGTGRSIKRVTEQIFVSDAQGERSYPTLTHSDD